MKNTTFAIVTVLLVCIIAFCIAGTVKGQEPGPNAEMEAWYREVEGQLLDDTKAYLSQEGFCNCGVTLNRIVDADGNREYTFTIHHSRIDKMSDADRHDLMLDLSTREDSALKADAFANCTFHYDFLIL